MSSSSSPPESKFIREEGTFNVFLNNITLGILMIIFISTSDFYPDLYRPDFIKFLSNKEPWFGENHWLTNAHAFFFVAIAFTVTAAIESSSAWWEYILYTFLIYIFFFVIIRMHHIAVITCLCLLVVEKFIYKRIKAHPQNISLVWIHRTLLAVIFICLILGYVLRDNVKPKSIVESNTSSEIKTIQERVLQLENKFKQKIQSSEESSTY